MDFEKIEKSQGSVEKDAKIKESWESIKLDCEDFFKSRIEERYSIYNPDDFEPGELEEEKKGRLEKALEREKNFFTRTLAETEKMCAENPESPKALLFDIDETVGRARVDHSADGVVITDLRPSITPLLEQLKQNHPNDLKIGILSSRGKESLDDQLRDNNHLETIAHFINNNLVFSTEKLGRGFGELSFEETVEYLESNPCLDRNKISKLPREPVIENGKRSDSMYDIMPQGVQKLEMLKRISKTMPDTVIAVVDDARFPKYLRYGVCLYPDGIFAGTS